MKRNAADLSYYYHVMNVDNKYKVKRSLFVEISGSLFCSSTMEGAQDHITLLMQKEKKTPDTTPTVNYMDWEIEKCNQYQNRRSVLENGKKIFVIEHYTETERDKIDNIVANAPAMYIALKELFSAYYNNGANFINDKGERMTQLEVPTETIKNIEQILNNIQSQVK